MLSTNETEIYLAHKPRYKSVTQTILSTIEPETHLSLNDIKIKRLHNKFVP